MAFILLFALITVRYQRLGKVCKLLYSTSDNWGIKHRHESWEQFWGSSLATFILGGYQLAAAAYLYYFFNNGLDKNAGAAVDEAKKEGNAAKKLQDNADPNAKSAGGKVEEKKPAPEAAKPEGRKAAPVAPPPKSEDKKAAPAAPAKSEDKNAAAPAPAPAAPPAKVPEKKEEKAAGKK